MRAAHIPARYHPLLLLLYLSSLLCLSLYLFTYGFFLTRYQLTDTATCDPLPHPSTISSTASASTFAYQPPTPASPPSPGRLFLPPSPTSAALSGCWLPSLYPHVVVLLIDALRYDFTAQLPSLSRALSRSPNSTLLLPFIADPPTVTLQRLSALTTGSLPTFIDFASNFHSSAISTDSLLHQFAARGPTWRSVFMGDDTWLSLYPQHFSSAYPYPSFNVKDLHTVDRGCLDHLLPTLHLHRRDPPERSLVIAHFLGVDHVGHRYDAVHPAMGDKLREMDGIVEEVVRFVDERPDVPTLLMVMGDHGMTEDGNHGGATPLETTSALFVHASGPVGGEGWNTGPAMVGQIDFVPTVALLMGLPVPFGALGAVIPQLFRPAGSTGHVLAATYLNAYSVWRYLSVYQATTGSFDAATMAELGSVFVKTSEAYGQWLDSGREAAGDEEGMGAIADGFRRYLDASVSMCREKWATFNLPSMAAGIAGLSVTTAMTAVLLLAAQPGSMALLPVMAAPAAWGAAAGGALALLVFSLVSSIPFFPLFLLSAAWCSAVAVFASLVSALFRGYASVPLSSLGLPGWVALLCVVGYMQGLFSNSFIVNEPHVVSFLSMSILLAALPTSTTPRWTQLLCLVAFRLTREVGDVIPSSTLSSTFFTPFELLCIVVSLTSLPLLLSAMAARQGWARGWVHRGVVPAACALCGVYWTLQSSSSEGAVTLPVVSALLARVGLGGLDAYVIRLVVPQLVYASSYLGAALLLLSSSPPSQGAPRGLTASELNVSLFSLFLPSFLLLLGPKSAVLFLLVLLVVRYHPFTPAYSLPHVVFLFFLSLSLFFSSSHAQAFSSLQISAAFVGFDDFHLVPAGLMLAGNTFVHLYMLGGWVGGEDWRVSVGVLWLFGVRLLCTTCNAWVNRRHLMVWEIFAPKFVFDGLSTVVIAAVLTLTQAAVTRATGVEVKGVAGQGKAARGKGAVAAE